MESHYDALLEKTRLPQPFFQRFAVVSIFRHLESSPGALGPAPTTCHEAISQCLRSHSSAVVDQAVRELCRLVAYGNRYPTSVALIELQSNLEGCEPHFVPVFVKGIGFLCRMAFRNDTSWVRHFDRAELHPFVKVLSCCEQAQEELIQQVLLFIVRNKSLGINEVVRFLRPFIMFSVMWKPTSCTYFFSRNLISAIASLSCSFPLDAISILKLLTECLKYLPSTNEKEFIYIVSSAAHLVDAYVEVLQRTAGAEKEMTSDAQRCSTEILSMLLSFSAYFHGKPHGQIEAVVGISRNLLKIQKKLGLSYAFKFVEIVVSASVILAEVEFEHDQLCVLKLLILLMEWKTEELSTQSDLFPFREELLIVVPVISLISSPSKSVKVAATHLHLLAEHFLLDFRSVSEEDDISSTDHPIRVEAESIPLRLLHRIFTKEFIYIVSSAAHLVDAYVEVLQRTVGAEKEMTSDAQRCSTEILSMLLSFSAYFHGKPHGQIEAVVGISRNLLKIQKKLGLSYAFKFVEIVVSASVIFAEVEFEHDQLCVLKLLILLMEWKTEGTGSHNSDLKEYPGAALLLYGFTRTEPQGLAREVPKVHATFEMALVEIAQSLPLSRNILNALLALESWKEFIGNWIKSLVTTTSAKGSSLEQNNSLNCAAKILKICCKVAVDSVPQVSANASLAICALCLFSGCSTVSEIVIQILAKVRLVKDGWLLFSELDKLKYYVLNFSLEGTSGMWWSVLMELVAALSLAEASIRRQWLLDALDISAVTENPSTAISFIGLLAGSCCKYMPLIVDPKIVLIDLPMTLPSLLSSSYWGSMAESVARKLWLSTMRIVSLSSGLIAEIPNSNIINETDIQESVFLSRIIHRTCLSLKDYLPLDKRLRLASLEVP